MALSVGNKTFSLAIPSANSQTVSHNQDVGADGFLLVACQMNDGVTYTGATYNGVSMSVVQSFSTGNPFSQDYIVYGLLAPSTGSNDVVVSFTGVQNNAVSIAIYSFTGSLGAGNFGSDTRTTSPHTQPLVVSAGSRVFVASASTALTTALSVDGVNTPIEYSHNTNREISGGLSLPIASAGSVDVVTTAGANVTNYRTEILEAGGGGGVSVAEGNWWQILNR